MCQAAWIATPFVLLSQGTRPVRKTRDMQIAQAPTVSRPLGALAANLGALLEFMLVGLRSEWGGGGEAEVAARMQRAARTISGGIELDR